jgi:type VI secretion system protein ImpK
MREEYANVVYPVIDYGLALKVQVDKGNNQLDLENEQAALMGLLGNEPSARRLADFAGDGSSLEMSLTGGTLRGTSDAGRRGDGFLGIRYILACWLDEIMTDSPWGEEWREKTLEQALYKTRERAWKFWEQSRKAEGRPGSDALEVIFLCVMLGFRGDLIDAPDRLRSWVNTVQTRIAQSQGKEWAAPHGAEPVTNVPPLRGRERMQKMIVAWACAVLVAILFLAFYVMFWLRNSK